MRAEDRPEEESGNPARSTTMRAEDRPEEESGNPARSTTMRAEDRPEEESGNPDLQRCRGRSDKRDDRRLVRPPPPIAGSGRSYRTPQRRGAIHRGDARRGALVAGCGASGALRTRRTGVAVV